MGAEQVKITELPTVGVKTSKDYIDDVCLSAGVHKQELAVVTCTDLSTTIVSSALLHQLRAWQSALGETTPHYIFYPEGRCFLLAAA